MKTTTNPTDVGMNRTGIDASPADSKRAIASAKEGVPTPTYDVRGLEAARVAYSEDATPLGTVPPPGTLKGMAKTAVGAVKGEKPTVFIDALAERLAFERSGTRFYEALLAKFEAADAHPQGPTRADLEKFRDDELRHAALLEDCLRELGADPTAMTPSADVIGMLGSGIGKVVTDPRTTFTEALKAIQVAELADNDGWDMLADLADKSGHKDMGDAFALALEDEEIHLRRVREWLSASVFGQAGVAENDAGTIEPGARMLPTP